MVNAEIKALQEIQEKRGSNRAVILSALVLCILIVSGAYWYVSSKTVYIDLSSIQAPVIKLSPVNSGPLQAVFVDVGDRVTANQPIARVGGEIVEAQTSGEIVSIDKNIGEFENTLSGQAVVATMVDPSQLRVVGRLDEDKGLSSVKVDDRAMFTVDAFGAKKYYGVVDEIGQISQGYTTTNIFDQRPTNQFNVNVRFDPMEYPELKDGMSARIWIYK
jgi:multidrug resistance efflux pump